jgi:hypothetical protein
MALLNKYDVLLRAPRARSCFSAPSATNPDARQLVIHFFLWCTSHRWSCRGVLQQAETESVGRPRRRARRGRCAEPDRHIQCLYCIAYKRCRRGISTAEMVKVRGKRVFFLCRGQQVADGALLVEAEDEGSRDEHVGASLLELAGVAQRDAAVDLDPRVDAARRAERLELLDLVESLFDVRAPDVAWTRLFIYG